MTRYLGAAVLITALGLSACSEKSATNPPAATLAMTLGSSSGQITQAGTLAVLVNITRSNFEGTVTVTASGVAGVTAGSLSIAGNASTGTLTLTADAAAAPGSGTVTVTATGPNGTPTATATLSLTVNVRGTYTLSASPATLPLVQGATANVTIGVNRAGNFQGTVTLATQAPTGLTATVTPGSVSGTTSTATLAVSASSALAPGTYSVTVTGTTAGLANQVVSVSVTVTAAGSYTLSISPSTLSLAAGASGSANVAINRTNFAATVNLTATAPTGVTATVTPAAATGTTAVLDITVGAGVAAGSYTITVNGTAAGAANQVATLSLTVTAAGSFSIAATPATLSVPQGGTGMSSVNLTRTNFTTDVTLTATAPTGVTVNFAPATLSGGTLTSQMTVTVGGAVATGTVLVTVRANATGQTEQTATLSLTVTAAGTFSIAVTPATLSVPQGGTGTGSVNLTRTNFTTDVTLTATAPTGVTVNFAPATLSGGTLTSQITVTVGGAVATGTVQVTVRANATGQTEKTATVSLTVTTSQGSGNVTFAFCGDSGIPLLVAMQDGSGSWNAVTLSGTNQASFQISSGRGAIAWVARPDDGQGYSTWVFYGTLAELQSYGTGLCFGTTGAGKTITGSALGVSPPFDIGFITLGNAQAQLTGGASNFTLNNVIDGPLDLIAARNVGTIGTGGISYVPNSLIIQRNQNLANGAVIPQLNFANGVQPASATLTFSNAGADWTGLNVLYVTPRNTSALLYNEISLTAQANRMWYGFPGSSMQSGELHLLNAFAVVPTMATATQTRQVMFATANVANITASFGPALNAPTISVLGTSPYLRLRLAHTPQSEYNRYYTSSFSQGSGAASRGYIIQKTAGYVTAGGSTNMDIEDFSSVAGWQNVYALMQGVQTFWLLSSTGWTGGSGIFSPVIVEGAMALTATRFGDITP